jgi:3-methylfumaryl-CoA hydratase
MTLNLDLAAWIGRTHREHDTVGPTPLRALAATLDQLPPDAAPGTPLPPLWHWLYGLPLQRQSELGPDGHARRGSFLPPVPLPRRMWAGSRFEFREPLRVGDAIERRSTIEAVHPKHGRSGPLVFVTVRHEFHRNVAPEAAMVEWHDIVYREARAAGAGPELPGPPTAAPVKALWQRRVVPDDVLLFRYSALTFNSHRIHYDRRYVTEVEGYPGLVVHGPLVATLLLDLLHRHAVAAQLSRFHFTALRPVFDGEPLQLCGEPAADGRSVRLWAQDAQGALALDATAVLRAALR